MTSLRRWLWLVSFTFSQAIDRQLSKQASLIVSKHFAKEKKQKRKSDYRTMQSNATAILGKSDDQFMHHDDESSNSSFDTDDDVNLVGVNANQDQGDRSDAPEALVRKDNNAVTVTRLLLFIVLAIAAITTAFMIFKFTSDSEQEAFDSDFDGIATKIVEGMLSDVSLRFWMTRTIANAVTMGMESSGEGALNMTLPPLRWDKITQEARFNGNALMVTWSPILSNDQDRADFEKFAKPQEFSIGQNPECFLCGSPNMTFTNPNDLAELIGFGLAPCGALESTGRQGILPPENCGLLSAALSETCKCGILLPGTPVATKTLNKPDQIFRALESGPSFEPQDSGPYSPIWQATALDVIQMPIMYNQMSEPIKAKAIQNMLDTSMPVISEIFIRDGAYYKQYAGIPNVPSSTLYYPVFDPTDQYMVGSVGIDLSWEGFATGVFPPNSQFVDIVVENSCGQNYTFHVDQVSNAFSFAGEGDLTDKSFHTGMIRSTSFEEYESLVNFAGPVPQDQEALDYCRYRFIVYPTEALEDLHVTSDPYIYAGIVAAVFVFTSLVFVLYDVIVTRRQAKVMASAKRTNDIVSSLFPKNVRDRLFEEAHEKQAAEAAAKKKNAFLPSKKRMETFLDGGESSSLQKKQTSVFGSEPIADLFPHTTVMFLDIANFTAWSSERDPGQVFKLLENIYSSFDQLAKAMGVFKVETIGGSYVAVCGLPKSREHHAVVMAKFARHCLKRMNTLTKELEVCLGPSTGELKARIGLHSGPVTAGVLRGEKARFQLFGDTVNTAARLESSSSANRIHCSKTTMELLVAAGKGDWAQPRHERVSIKGKGEMETFWVYPRSNAGSVASVMSGNGLEDGGDGQLTDAQQETKMGRLVDWNVEVLCSLLEKVVTSRGCLSNASSEEMFNAEQKLIMKDEIVLDEMTQILDLPEFDGSSLQKKSILLPADVKEQLRDFVATIANLYRDVPFHNFEHASHVIMSTGKLMKRIVNPDGIDYDLDGVENKELAIMEQIYKLTYGISGDPLLMFSSVFSALIHDVDHTGLTNAELVKMNTPASAAYRQKSVAEQNSVDVAWVLLMSDNYKGLRSCIYTNTSELARFRQLIVNAVMATDIADKELKTLRESRWADAFSESAQGLSHIDVNRKATITFEYIIQASDIAHTMQHWQTYMKFNGRLFEERYVAWVKGAAGEKCPADGWYGGEIWFYDNYIIPLARKLHKCGVFGVSYHEYLNYALENKKEWMLKGHDVVADMLAQCQAKYGSEINPARFEQGNQ